MRRQSAPVWLILLALAILLALVGLRATGPNGWSIWYCYPTKTGAALHSARRCEPGEGGRPAAEPSVYIPPRTDFQPITVPSVQNTEDGL